MDKVQARKKGKVARESLPLDLRQEKENSLFQQCVQASKEIQIVGCYYALKGEVETKPFLQWCIDQGKTLALPKVQGDTLQFFTVASLQECRQGVFGVYEPPETHPIEIEQIEKMFVPLLAYDSKNHRVGYGKGYYDSILNRCKHTIGLAFTEQEVPFVEEDAWDVRLHEIFTA